MVDGAVGAERVEGKAEEGISSLARELQRQMQRGRIHQLVQAVQGAWDQQHMAVLDGAHIDEYEVGRAGHRGHGQEGGALGGHVRGLKLEEHLLLQRLGEVEFGGIEWLHNLQGHQRLGHNLHLSCQTS